MDNLLRLTTVEVAGVDRVVDDAVLVDLVVADHHLDLEELVLAHGGGQLLVRRGVLAGVSIMLLEHLAAGVAGGDGGHTPEPAVLGPRIHVRRRDDPAETRRPPTSAHHHAVVAMGAAGAEAYPICRAQPRGEAGGLTNETAHYLLLHLRSILRASNSGVARTFLMAMVALDMVVAGKR